MVFGFRVGGAIASIMATLFATVSGDSVAQAVRTPHVEAELISRTEGFVPGQPIEAALRLKIKEHWHTYWRNPGDSGLPTKLDWRLPAGFSAGSIEWPYPKRLPLGPLMNFGYEGEVLHLVKINTPSGWPLGKRAEMRAKAEWLVCSDVCIPESAELTLAINAAGPTPAPSKFERAFAAAIDALPVQGPQATFSMGEGKLHIRAEAIPAGSSVSFFPYVEGVVAPAAPQSVVRAGDSVTLTAALAEPNLASPKKLEGILVAEGGWPSAAGRHAIEISAVPGVVAASGASIPVDAANLGLVMALVLGAAGGLLLNLMPCVFPVLGIKVMQFADHAHGDRRQLRNQGWAYASGVVVSFWGLSLVLLALKAAGHAIGWGFQLQSPEFVFLLCALFLLLSLNLLGCFEWGSRLQQFAGTKDTSSTGVRAAFLTGVLATLVATPCTAPFMGAALGYTLSQPVFTAMMVFTSIGIGMALPVLLLCLYPRLIARLPKPGRWMEAFKQLMAFPLLATIVWLLWVLGSQVGNDGVARALAGLVVLALAAWIYGRWQVTHPRASMVTALALGLLGAWTAWPATSDPRAVSAVRQDAQDDWVAFSASEVQRLRAEGTPVFIDFTASWCITCQVNKRTTLQDREVQQRMKALGVRMMRADWSRQDPDITKALAEFGRNGVPLYVYYPSQAAPKVLPEILTPGVLLAALSGR